MVSTISADGQAAEGVKVSAGTIMTRMDRYLDGGEQSGLLS